MTDSGKKSRKCHVYRLYCWMRYFSRARIPMVPDIIRKYIRVVCACELSYRVELGRNIHFLHNGLGVVIHAGVRIGDETTIHQHVTIGGYGREFDLPPDRIRVPTIGKGVIIFAGAVVVGPIHIGDGAIIAANSLVLKSVKPHSLVGGIPAQRLWALSDPKEKGFLAPN